MAHRPVFIPNYSGALLVQERFFDFSWSPGFAESQKKKNVAAGIPAVRPSDSHQLAFRSKPTGSVARARGDKTVATEMEPA